MESGLRASLCAMSDANVNDAVRRALGIPLDDEVCALLLTSPSSELRPLVEGILSGDGTPAPRVVSAAVAAIEAAARGEFTLSDSARGNEGGAVTARVAVTAPPTSSTAAGARGIADTSHPPPPPAHARSAASSSVERGFGAPPTAARAWNIVPPASRPTLCECMATTHALLGLCLHCGKILCELERGVACSACGATPVNGNAVGSGSGTTSRSESSDAAALAHRDRLLEFDRTSAARTAIVDDDCEYFASNSTAWLSPAEEAAALAAAAAARSLHTRGGGKSMRISIDVMGGIVTDLDAAAIEAARLEQLDRVRIDVARRSERTKTSTEIMRTAAGSVGSVDAAVRAAPNRPVSAATTAPPAALGAGTYANNTLTGGCKQVYAEIQAAAHAARARSEKSRPDVPAAAQRGR